MECSRFFFVDLYKRFSLNCQYRKKDVSNWLGEENEPLIGFEWRGGSQRVTTGILMWSDVFTWDYNNGEKIAIILLDTQGIFDIGSTVLDCTKIFALSTMLSSVQCYNLFHNIQEDDLQYLNLFTEYGRLALEGSNQKPFQRLQFIVRDWSYPYEAEYGSIGGQKILQQRMSSQLATEANNLRTQIDSCFSEINCFLLPHPGSSVCEQDFDGRLSSISDKFKICLKTLVPMLFAPENLIVKQVHGVKLRAQDLEQYLKSYVNAFTGGQLPEPLSIYKVNE